MVFLRKQSFHGGSNAICSFLNTEKIYLIVKLNYFQLSHQ
jgi:hypothetical protein